MHSWVYYGSTASQSRQGRKKNDSFTDIQDFASALKHVRSRKQAISILLLLTLDACTQAMLTLIMEKTSHSLCLSLSLSVCLSPWDYHTHVNLSQIKHSQTIL